MYLSLIYTHCVLFTTVIWEALKPYPFTLWSLHIYDATSHNLHTLLPFWFTVWYNIDSAKQLYNIIISHYLIKLFSIRFFIVWPFSRRLFLFHTTISANPHYHHGHNNNIASYTVAIPCIQRKIWWEQIITNFTNSIDFLIQSCNYA